MRTVLITLLILAVTGASAFAQISKIEISPAGATVMVGETVQFEATAYSRAGEAVADPGIIWTFAGAIGSFDEATGEFTATTVGSGTLTASAGLIYKRVNLEVVEYVAPVVESIAISPPDTSVTVGETVQYTAAVTYSDGKVDTEPVVAWDVTDAAVGTVDETGLFTAVAGGDVGVTATFEALSDTADVVVTAFVRSISIVVPEVPAAVSIGISPADTTIEAGGTVQFTAAVEDSEGNPVEEPELAWEVSDAAIGTIDEAGLFTSVVSGTVTVTVTSGELSAEAVVTVTEVEPEAIVAVSIEISPADTTIEAGGTVQFIAAVEDSEGNPVENPELTWEVSDAAVGVIDEIGQFIAVSGGPVTVTVTSGELSAEAVVTVTEVEPKVNLDGATVTFYRVNPVGKLVMQGEPVGEGGSIQLAGMGHPYNFLNGMKLTFPKGSLVDPVINITYEIPRFAKVAAKRVAFDGDIVSGVTFRVYVGEICEENLVAGSYHFGVPLELTLPYSPGLLRNLGIDPAGLGMFFANEDGIIGAGDGAISSSLNVADNMITGQVPHFSTVVIAPKTAAPTAVDAQAPTAFALSQNVPNPFNPVTSISYQVMESSHVTLDIYNVVGQHVRNLVDEVKPAGSFNVLWDGTNMNGERLTSGVYFYRMRAGNASLTRKLMLLR